MVGDRLWGTADPGSIVEVKHHSQRDIVRYETADGDGNWLADFSVPGDEPGEGLIHNFNEDTRFMVMQNDEDGDHTQIDWQMPHPSFVMQLTQNQVWTWNWPLGYAVTLAIDDPGNGPGTDYSATADPAPCDWDPGTGCFWITLGEAFRARPGHLVTLTNGFITLTHTVSAVQVSDIDSDADTVSGTAERGAKVHVQMQYLRGTIQRHVTAGEAGNWTADFSVPGDEVDEQLTIDLIPWHEGTATVRDNNGGATEVTWPIELEINVGDEIRAINWYYGDEVTLTVDDPATPAAPDYTDSGFPGVGPWAYTGLEFDIGATFRTRPGHIVELAQFGRSKTCVVSPIVITGVDYITDRVIGVSNPNAQVLVSVPVGSGDEWARYRYTQADANGQWQVDFSQPGTHIIRHPNEIEIVDIVPEMSVGAAEGTEDACFTDVWTWVRMPVIRVRLTAGQIYASNYLPGYPVTLTVYQPGDLVNPVHTDTKIMGNDNLINFEYPDTLDIGAGYLVRTTDGVVTKEHSVTSVWINSVDGDLDKVYGVAEAGTPVTVVARSTSVRAQRDLTADSGGFWTADFSQPGNEPWEQDTIELEATYIIFAYQSDEDSDITWVHWVENHPPEIGAIAGPADPVAVNTEVQVSASFSDPDADDTHTATIDWGDGTPVEAGIVTETGGSGTVSGSHVYADDGVYTLEVCVTDDDGATGCGTFQVTVYPVAADDFNRYPYPYGYAPIGPNWRGETTTGDYRIVNNEVQVFGGPIYWKLDKFGADQEAWVTLTQIDAKGHHGILLKVQGDPANWKWGVIGVSYSNYEKPRNQIKVETYVPKQGWRTLALFDVPLRHGDRLGARALADGTVEAYVNGVKVGEADAGPFFVDKGGFIGLWFISPSSPHAILDDFAGR